MADGRLGRAEKKKRVCEAARATSPSPHIPKTSCEQGASRPRDRRQASLQAGALRGPWAQAKRPPRCRMSSSLRTGGERASGRCWERPRATPRWSRPRLQTALPPLRRSGQRKVAREREKEREGGGGRGQGEPGDPPSGSRKSPLKYRRPLERVPDCPPLLPIVVTISTRAPSALERPMYRERANSSPVPVSPESTRRAAPVNSLRRLVNGACVFFGGGRCFRSLGRTAVVGPTTVHRASRAIAREALSHAAAHFFPPPLPTTVPFGELWCPRVDLADRPPLLSSRAPRGSARPFFRTPFFPGNSRGARPFQQAAQ